MSDHPVDLYDNYYGHFADAAKATVRRETWGEDIGQSSWLTAEEWLGFAERAAVRGHSEILEVGSGSGGPAIYLAEKLGCHVTGVDINDNGVRNGTALAAERGMSDRVSFHVADANRPLPFPDASFDAILSNDSMCHLADRSAALRDWYRMLRPGGRMLFTDAMVVTGPLSHVEIAARSSIGFYLFVPPGSNEQLIRDVGFELHAVEDLTEAAAAVAGRWHDARAQHRDALIAIEGDTNYEGLQFFLATVRDLSAQRRLSRFAYLGRKPETA